MIVLLAQWARIVLVVYNEERPEMERLWYRREGTWRDAVIYGTLGMALVDYLALSRESMAWRLIC